jgi:hypothetical protein
LFYHSPKVPIFLLIRKPIIRVRAFGGGFDELQEQADHHFDRFLPSVPRKKEVRRLKGAAAGSAATVPLGKKMPAKPYQAALQ